MAAAGSRSPLKPAVSLARASTATLETIRLNLHHGLRLVLDHHDAATLHRVGAKGAAPPVESGASPSACSSPSTRSWRIASKTSERTRDERESPGRRDLESCARSHVWVNETRWLLAGWIGYPKLCESVSRR
ncbi:MULTISPECIES: hypothetical protein [unclassified Micromonospora]|uniref:hypothetical protein n=1 Tax=unclassified Micromonospora TaxID=2617518 RepID=UPI0033B77D09